MPAEVVIIHPDSPTASALAVAFRARGWTVRYYADPLLAMDALEKASLIELLLTCVRFADGRSNGQALALMARQRRPDVKLLFMCAPSDEHHVCDLGECVALPVDLASVVIKGEKLLQDRPVTASTNLTASA
jgi:DNA-binding response OmpR family regulator